MSIQCPRCGSEAKDLIKIEAGLRLRIQENSFSAEDTPAEVCVNCFREVSASVSQGAKLRAEINAKAHNKRVLWKNRISLVKSARDRMVVKAYAEAAILYEKYIRTLEISQDQSAGNLNPEAFNNPAQKKELTILASVYWDLIRIYDSNPSYTRRMEETVKKLSEVLPISAASTDIIARAERFYRVANNDVVIKDFLKEARKKQGAKCFIATAAFGHENADEVLALRRFRDEVLNTSYWGRSFTSIYYLVSPPIAKFLRLNPSCRPIVRKALRPIALRLAKKFNLNIQS